MLVKKLFNLLLYILVVFVSYVSLIIFWVFFFIVIIILCIYCFIGFFFWKCKVICVVGVDFDLMFGNYIDTERVECFSDGVFFIVVIFFVLDIIIENFLKDFDVKENGIDKIVLKMWFKFLVYVVNFIVIVLLWFVYYFFFYCIKIMN